MSSITTRMPTRAIVTIVTTVVKVVTYRAWALR